MKIAYLFPVVLLALAACDSLPSWMGGAKKEIAPLPGEREDVLKADTAFKADEILQKVSFQLPPASENVAWMQHTGQFSALTSNLSVKGDMSSRQKNEVGEGNAFSHTLVPRPVVADGRIYAMDAAGFVSAHELSDISRKLWVSPALVMPREAEVMGGGLAADGGKLYMVSGIGRVAAVDAANGSESWRRELGIPLRSAPRVAGKIVFVITIDSQLFALDAANGATLWTHRGIGETAGLMNNVSPTVVSDMVIVPYASGELYALKLDTGDEVWRASLAQAKRTEASAIFSGVGGDPVVDESVVFAVSSSGLFSVFNLLNAQPVWEKPIASINTPWVVGEYVFVLTEDNRLIAMVKYDGRVRWSIQLKSFEDAKRRLKPIVWRGPVMVSGKLVMVSTAGEMLVVDGATGDITSTIEVADHISTAPVVAGGKIFVVGKDARLYSYQ